MSCLSVATKIVYSWADNILISWVKGWNLELKLSQEDVCWWHMRSVMDLLPYGSSGATPCLLEDRLGVSLSSTRTNWHVTRGFIPVTEQHEPGVQILYSLVNVTYLLDVTLATHCHTYYHLHPFSFVLFKVKDLVAKQHPTSVVNLPVLFGTELWTWLSATLWHGFNSYLALLILQVALFWIVAQVAKTSVMPGPK